MPFLRPPAWFQPVMAGATPRDRLLACAGVLAGLAAIAAVLSAVGHTSALPLLVAPVGASAVLAFAVPASPLAQPWSIVGGNSLSALMGIAAVALIPSFPLAAGLAVAAAILLMSVARCLHPPGGAVALSAVIGGATLAPGPYVLTVAVNSAALVATAWLFHRFSGHAYPHRANDQKARRELQAEGLRPVDIEYALKSLGEAFDVAPADLELLLARAEQHAAKRRADEAARGPELRRAA